MVPVTSHMVLGYHKTDLRKLPDQQEDEVLARMKTGPLVMMTVAPGAPPAMGTSLTLWFVYVLIVSVFSAYIASRAVQSGADYLTVFRFVGTPAFMGYSLALLHESIWYKRSWIRTFKSMFDGLVYALLTAGVFGWLWAGR